MNKLKRIFYSCVILVFAFVTAFLSFFVLEPKTYDFMVKNVMIQRLPFDTKKNIYGHDDVVLVMIDNKSIEKYRWPWKRELYNKVLEYFKDYAHPKVVAHDFIIRTLDKDNPASDKKYFNSIKNFDNLVEGVMYMMLTPYNNKEDGIKYDKFFMEKFSIKNAELNTYLPQLYVSILQSPQDYLVNVKHMGSVAMIPGYFDGNMSIRLGDETYRTHEYLLNYKGSIMPSLAFNSFLIANNNPRLVVDDKYIKFPDLNYKIRYIKTPLQAIVPIRFYNTYETGYAHKSYSAVDIMDSFDKIKNGQKPIINPNEFENKIVVFGANVTAGNGLNDNKKTPVKTIYSGTDMQATSIDNIFHNDFINILPLWVNLLLIFSAMSAMYFVIRKNNIIKAIIYSFTILMIIMLIAAICYYNKTVISLATPISLSLYTIMIAYVHKYLIEEGKKKKVTNALGKYMSEDVMKKVLQNIDNLGLGGKKATVTVLFSDIRGFTSLSEKLSAQEVSNLLNEYFSEMEPIVTKYNGIINKFIGDAVMAVFGEPIQDEKHPINAVLCGYEMLKKVEELDKKWHSENKSEIKIGVGINTGDVFIGNIGSEKRMEYTVIGDTVNLASRLESYNKTFGTQMLISFSTYEYTKHKINVKKISDVEIRGKANKMDIYEVIDIIK